VSWYFDDHLGTPVLQTDTDGRVVWRPEYEPYGAVFAYRRGEARHQPLRFPGQESDGSDTSYNIYRWYRSGWGRYTQSDPIGLGGGLNVFRYAIDNPASFYDRSGLVTIDLSSIAAHKLFTIGDLDSRCADTQGGVSGGACTRSYYALGRCNCLCLGFGMWAPVAQIEVHGDMFIYNGFWPTFLQHRKPRDSNVVSAATAEHHEYAWHISPALAALVQTVAHMEANFYFGKPACDSQCTAIAQTVNSEFARLMALSQQLEQNGQNPSTPGLVH
jgi:RHS repeat-associated protein